jgi:RimJ/RimL family protein N-acetyltransferase
MQRECLVAPDPPHDVVEHQFTSSTVTPADQHFEATALSQPHERDVRMRIKRLMSGEERQVLEFLNRQPLKNLQMAGFILDNGLESARNRGAFYGCFDDGYLIGVALVGHWVFLSGGVETVSIFARIARFLHAPEVSVVLGEAVMVNEFARVFADSARQHEAHQDEAKLLLSVNHLDGDTPELEGLRPAADADADEVAHAHALTCMELLGKDPTQQNPSRLRECVRARIGMGRIWIVRDERGIGFKTDIASETEQAVYLEGIWTRPDLRGQGLGTRALRSLCRRLLLRQQVVCLFADAANARVNAFYQRVGFTTLAPYRLIRYAN